jgi:hypothetical protein
MNLPDKCAICNAAGTVIECDVSFSPPVIFLCEECGYWGETADDLKYSPEEAQMMPLRPASVMIDPLNEYLRTEAFAE